MKFLNDLIKLSFQNDKTLLNERILSKGNFPVKTLVCDRERTYATIDLSDEKVFDEYIRYLSRYIIKKYEDKILKRIITKNYPEIPKYAIAEILTLKKETDIRPRQKTVEKILKSYFCDHKEGNVEGIVRFRFFEYKKILKELADELVDVYYLNREYEDFIELLRYFISVQEFRTELVYINVLPSGTYLIFDEKRNDITKECINEFVSNNEIKDASFDDLLISILITLAPTKIVVENKEYIKNVQLFETIEKVFEKIEYKNRGNN